jgi:hypothetical protein
MNTEQLLPSDTLKRAAEAKRSLCELIFSNQAPQSGVNEGGL